MSTSRSEPTTTTFRGADDLVLVADEWNKPGAAAKAGTEPDNSRPLVLMLHCGGRFESLEDAAAAVAAYLPHRTKPRSPDGLKKNLRQRHGRRYWHWDPAFLTKPQEDPFLRVELPEQAAMELSITILLIRGRLSDVVSEEAVQDFLNKVPNAEFVESPGAGHTAGDDNDAFSDVVVDFISRI